MIPLLILSLNVSGGLTTDCNHTDRFVSYGAKTYVLGESTELCANSSSVDDFIAELEQDYGDDFLADGRKWFAESFYRENHCPLQSSGCARDGRKLNWRMRLAQRKPRSPKLSVVYKTLGLIPSRSLQVCLKFLLRRSSILFTPNDQ